MIDKTVPILTTTIFTTTITTIGQVDTPVLLEYFPIVIEDNQT